MLDILKTQILQNRGPYSKGLEANKHFYLVSTAFLVYSVHVYVKVASDLIYSPTSAWWKQTAVIGSACLHSAVDLAATPNPRGKSFME